MYLLYMLLLCLESEREKFMHRSPCRKFLELVMDLDCTLLIRFTSSYTYSKRQPLLPGVAYPWQQKGSYSLNFSKFAEKISCSVKCIDESFLEKLLKMINIHYLPAIRPVSCDNNFVPFSVYIYLLRDRNGLMMNQEKLANIYQENIS